MDEDQVAASAPVGQRHRGETHRAVRRARKSRGFRIPNPTTRSNKTSEADFGVPKKPPIM
ncbi:MAG: hypothetical protein MZU97_15110 [Bacillus subtilis]|nr:hypothetical protein [Bacillus subtilis]